MNEYTNDIAMCEVFRCEHAAEWYYPNDPVDLHLCADHYNAPAAAPTRHRWKRIGK